MIAETIVLLLEGIGLGAIAEHVMVPVTHGETSRFCILDPGSRLLYAILVPAGEIVRVHRGHRLIIEPIDTVRLRSLCCVSSQWTVQ